jgi:prepilin-type N-terminal cleavage/methylation domain-containing protein
MSRRGFTMIELLLTTILGGIVIGAAVFLFANMAGSFSERDTAYQFAWASGREGNVIPMAPAYSQVPNAMNLQMVLGGLLTVNTEGSVTQEPVSAIYVVGGEFEDGPGAANGTAFPDDTAAPVLTTAIGPDVAEILTSPTDFKNHISTGALSLSPTTEEVADSFSIYFLRQRTAGIAAAVHCRRADHADTGLTVYTVSYWDASGLRPEYSYAYALPTAQANDATVRPGAVHYWLRKNDAWMIRDHVGAQVVFPDPTSMPYAVAAGDASRAFSRYVLFLPTKL